MQGHKPQQECPIIKYPPFCSVLNDSVNYSSLWLQRLANKKGGFSRSLLFLRFADKSYPTPPSHGSCFGILGIKEEYTDPILCTILTNCSVPLTQCLVLALSFVFPAQKFLPNCGVAMCITQIGFCYFC